MQLVPQHRHSHIHHLTRTHVPRIPPCFFHIHSMDQEFITICCEHMHILACQCEFCVRLPTISDDVVGGVGGLYIQHVRKRVTDPYTVQIHKCITHMHTSVLAASQTVLRPAHPPLSSGVTFCFRLQLKSSTSFSFPTHATSSLSRSISMRPARNTYDVTMMWEAPSER